MLEKLYIGFVAFLDKIIWTIDVGPSVHKFFLSPHIGNFRVALGKVRAVRLYRQAVKKVPAYKDFIDKHPGVQGPKIGLVKATLNDVPEMDKNSYIKQYGLKEKIWHSELPTRGIMFDESSGSSGVPTSWVRGPKERRFTQRIMQVAFRKYIGKTNPIIINTFSMGAWATGLNTTLCLVGVSRIKSTGPDVVKVINTLKELGDEIEYVISGYPPFLKQIADSDEIDWKKYHVSAIYGGEGISEPMRLALLKRFKSVIGSYGASDLEINIAHESEFTIALRQALIEDEKLREALLVQNRGILPSVFQYNPYDYLIETNENGELLITICRLENLSPRIRYNIHDLGHVEHFYDLKKTLQRLGRKDLLKYAELDFGVLFHYGRSDLSVDYNGAVVGPEEVKQILNAHDKYAQLVNNFRLIAYEDKTAHKHLLFAVELQEAVQANNKLEQEILSHIVDTLQITNLDFKSALSTSPLKPELRAYEINTGIFDAAHQKLKNDYVWNVDYRRAKQEGLIE
ncbi:MAG TPA: hypothetical protein VGE30_02165 [Candidatus Saccharimonadales bacterium]